eukprot:1255321-Prymnesium_polylepis.1
MSTSRDSSGKGLGRRPESIAEEFSDVHIRGSRETACCEMFTPTHPPRPYLPNVPAPYRSRTLPTHPSAELSL